MSARGFTLVELLVASVVSLVVLAAAVALAGAAQRVFVVEPAAIDTARRLHAATDALTQALGGAGGDQAVSEGLAALASGVPTVWPLFDLAGASGPTFHAVRVVRGLRRGVGRLAVDQPSPSESLTLASAPCPQDADLCGFAPDDVVAVFDGRGAFDLVELAAVAPALMRLTPRTALARAYPAGSWVVAVRVDRFGLVAQPDGSHTLTRVTSAGAREPMVDGIVSLAFRVWGHGAPPRLLDRTSGRGVSQYGPMPPAAAEADPAGVFAVGEHCLAARDVTGPYSLLAALGPDPLHELVPAMLDDGPWCPQAWAPDAYDADLFRVRRVDIHLRVGALADEVRGAAGLRFARGGTATDPAKWVIDRSLVTSVAVTP